jgi:hypothetical protein
MDVSILERGRRGRYVRAKTAAHLNHCIVPPQVAADVPVLEPAH